LNLIPVSREPWRDFQGHFGELPRATGLLFVAVSMIGLAPDGLAKRDARLGEIDVDIEAPAQPIGDDFKVQFALRGDQRLVQFGIDAKMKRRVFVLQCREPGSDAVFFAACLRLQCRVNARLRILDARQPHRSARGTKRVARVRTFQLHHRAEVARVETADRLAIASVKNVNLSETFGDIPAGVQHFHARRNAAGINAKEGQLAEMFLGHRLENLRHGFGTIERDLHLRVIRIDRLHPLPIDGR
jgi:hypothetical protein